MDAKPGNADFQMETREHTELYLAGVGSQFSKEP